jgi:hypothetical protein
MRNALVNLLNNISSRVFLNVNILGSLYILCQLLVSLMISVIKRTAIKAHHTGEAVHVVNSSGSGDFGTETVSTDRSHSKLVLVHEAHNVI